MRYIDTSCIVVPTNWVDLAKNQGFISNKALWTYFKADFELHFGKKCWYSESENIGSNNPIDHFRPKSSIVKALPDKLLNILGPSICSQLNCSSRSGYSFLKDEFSNFRYSCAIVNSPNTKISADNVTRGKWDYFPLRVDSISADSLSNLDDEKYCLLDPCTPSDPSFLTFTENGTVQAHKSILDGSWKYARVKVSIEVYHLHYFAFIEKRKVLWDSYREAIYLADITVRKKVKSESDQENLKHHLKSIVKALDKKTEFSAVAIDCILYYRDQFSWLKEYLPEKLLVK